MRVEIDGQSVSADELYLVSRGYGHFTAMQVRDQRAQGLDLHLHRLEQANRELFDAGLDHDRVRHLIRHALADTRDASVRVYIYENAAGPPRMLVSVRAPGGIEGPVRLKAFEYLRPQPELKHLATAQAFYRRLARRGGFDDALLIGTDGLVAETAVANIGFFDGGDVVWPQAPMLHGITMQLLEGPAGILSRRAPVMLSDMTRFSGAFVCNARGIAAVSQVDDMSLPSGSAEIVRVVAAFEAVPWDRI
jgi:branched-subunit amino acid aminotransferase/4-amino-4-deoxychorismate lyase